MNISGSRVLLTGATGGLGHAIARALHGAGADLVVSGRRADVLEPIARETGAAPVIADLADRAQLDALVEQAGEVDILVANAALPGSGDFATMGADRVDANIDVNFRAPIMLTHAVLPGMLQRGKGHLVMIGSLAGMVASPNSAMYNSTKFGIRGFAHALRHDLHGTGVGISVIHPGFVKDAGMFVESGIELPKGTRLVTPERVARDVVTAIRDDKGEVLSAPVELGLSARLGGLAPGLSARVQRMVGAADRVAAHTDGQH